MKLVKLKKIAKITSGSTAPKDKEFSIEGYPFIRVSHLDDLISESYPLAMPKITIEIANKRKMKLSEKESIVFAKSGMSCLKNRVLKLKEDSYIVNHLACVKVFSELVTVDYLRYYFVWFKPSKLVIDESYPSIRLSDIGELNIPVPPLETQKKIVEVLDKAQGLIDGRKEQIRLMDELIQSVFYEMFGDPNDIESKWEKVPLGELCTIVRGGSPRPINEFLGGNVPWIKIGDATQGDDIYLHSTKEHIIEEGIKKSRYIKEGSLIFANCGVSLGFARIITFKGCIHDGWLAFQDVNDRLDMVFLLKSLNMCTDYFRRTAPDGTQPNLNTTIMKSYMQIVPPIKKQKEFVRFLEHTDKLKFEVQKSLDENKRLFDSLIQEYFE